jgi:hypothetical protein
MLQQYSKPRYPKIAKGTEPGNKESSALVMVKLGFIIKGISKMRIMRGKVLQIVKKLKNLLIALRLIILKSIKRPTNMRLKMSAFSRNATLKQ